MSKIPYKPLEEHEIRVFQLLPGSDDEPLSGSLEHLNLADNFQPTTSAGARHRFNL